MGRQSLFGACRRIFRDGLSGTYEVGNENIFLELYHQSDIVNGTSIGDSANDRIVLIADDTITIPQNYTLTSVGLKKNLVIACNTLINNGTISMYQKAPSLLSYDLFIIGIDNLYSSNVVIPSNTENPSIIIFCNTFINNGLIDNDNLTYIYYTNFDADESITEDDSISLFQWDKNYIVKPIEKYMSRSNMIYFLNNYVQRLKQEE